MRDEWDTLEVHNYEKHFLVSPETRNKRIETCKACDKLTKWKTCKHCGCFMAIKTHLKMFDCPEKKWGTDG